MPSDPQITIYVKPRSNESFSMSSDSRSPNYRRPASIRGYTGHMSGEDDVIESVVVSQVPEKFMIRGYTGFRPCRRDVIGEPVVPSEAKQHMMKSNSLSPTSGSSGRFSPMSPSSKSPDNVSSPISVGFAENKVFRSFGAHMDLLERYATAVQMLSDDHLQSPEQLLRIVQAKFSERVHSYASQQLRIRKLFETFDFNRDGSLDEQEFRACLEKINLQFDDVQALALFASFDTNHDGLIEWKEFAERAMVQNPRGGIAVLPKVITQSENFGSTDDISISGSAYWRR